MSHLPLIHKIYTVAGTLLIFATWLFLVIVRPTSWESSIHSPAATVTLVGYLGGAIFLLLASAPHLRAQALALIPIALAMNIITGQVVHAFGIPLYLDSVGTVFVALLLGPLAGLATGIMTILVWAMMNPSVLPFAAISGLVGVLAGLAAQRNLLRTPVRAALVGGGVGVLTAAFAAPIAAFVYGGTAGLGTGAVVALFREMGNSLLGAVTLQSLLSDPLDKAIVFALAVASLNKLPLSVRSSFHTNANTSEH